MEVVYDVDYNYIPLYVKINLTDSITLDFMELQNVELSTLKNFRQSMENGNKSDMINEHNFQILCEDKIMNLYIEIGEKNRYGTLTMKIPCNDSLMNQFDKLIKIRECIEDKILFEYDS